MNVLIFNALLYIGYTLWGFKKCKSFSVHNAISCWFTFIAVMGVVSVHLKYYQMVFGQLHQLSYVPYILCFLSFIFLMLPLRKLNFSFVLIEDFPNKKNQFVKFLYIPILFLFLYTIVYIPSVISAFSYNDMAEVYNAQRIDGDDLYNYSKLELLIISIGRKFFNWFFGIMVFFSIWHLNITKKNEKYYYLYILMFLCSVAPYFLRTIATGGRGGFVFFSAKIIFVLLPLWAYLSKQFKKKLVHIAFVFLILGFIYAVSMTVARVSGSLTSNETPFSSVIRYFGEPFPNLGNNLWGQVKSYLMGHRMYPELFGFDIDNTNSQYDNFNYWQSICGVPVLNYKTIYGDFYLEFGPIYALIIIASIGLLMNLYIKKRRLSFIQLPLYSFYIDICVTAPLWFSRRNIGDLLIIIQCLIISYIIKKIFIKNQIK